MTSVGIVSAPIGLVASRYEHRTREVDFPGMTWTQLATANPNRWSILISAHESGQTDILPHNGQPALSHGGFHLETQGFIFVKFFEAPSFVTGEWWAFSNLAQRTTITEEIYLG